MNHHQNWSIKPNLVQATIFLGKGFMPYGIPNMLKPDQQVCGRSHLLKTLFSANHVTQNYLGGKTMQEKASIIRNATTQARVERSEDLKKRQSLLSALNEKLESSRKLIEEKEANRRDEKEKIVECIVAHGLWRTEQDICEGVKKLKTKANAVMKSQIKFWTLLLDLKDKINFTKSSLEELSRHLCKIASRDVPAEKQTILNMILNPESIVGPGFSPVYNTLGASTKCNVDKGNYHHV